MAFVETRHRPRHGEAHLVRWKELPDEAETTVYVAEMVLGLGRSSVDRLCKDGVLVVVMRGRAKRIKVGSIRKYLNQESK